MAFQVWRRAPMVLATRKSLWTRTFQRSRRPLCDLNGAAEDLWVLLAQSLEGELGHVGVPLIGELFEAGMFFGQESHAQELGSLPLF
ncbi:hypothetical protein [Mycobacterium sp. IDR2000157661]|uniref:hypothetical protein n=1 Tax=Mycobacterium sp. IDR2000157661 TaxID=2867005 RepID=UPI001EEAD2DB|nr:hypothetical protein [Mycobacterium sp. IDR2000157661]ULE31053.1 hypothetical protein K3G64_00560 [Mycobacterium sp. IDR2000157661]